MYRTKLAGLKQEYLQLSIEKQGVEKKLQEQQATLDEQKKLLEIKDISRTILQKTSDQAREKACAVLESTVTTALQYVFGYTFSAEIECDVSSGKPVADIYIVNTLSDGSTTKFEPQEACGGGIVDIVSIALRIAMIQLHNEPKILGPIILDEPGKFVSAEFSSKLAEFLKFISINFKKQIIFVTHNQDLKSISDTCYTARIVDGVTEVTKLDNPGGSVDV